MPRKAVSLSFNGLNKASLLICGESEGREKKDERKWNESTFGFHFIWCKVRRRERKEKEKINYWAHLNIISCPILLPPIPEKKKKK